MKTATPCPCAWCDRETGTIRPTGTSHGICKRHADTMRLTATLFECPCPTCGAPSAAIRNAAGVVTPLDCWECTNRRASITECRPFTAADHAAALARASASPTDALSARLRKATQNGIAT